MLWTGLGIVRKTTKLIEGGRHGLKDYRPMLLPSTFFYVFQNPKSHDFTFFAMFHTFSRTMINRCWWCCYYYASSLKSDFACCYRCYCSVVCLSVCHVRTLCSNGRRYWHDFLCIQQPHALPDRVKIQLIPVNPFFPKFCSKDKVTRPLLIWASGDIRWQIVTEWLAIAQWSQWRADRKPQSLFRMVSSLASTTSPFPKWGWSQNALQD